MTNNDWIAQLLQNEEIALLGFADLKEIPPENRQDLPYGICFAIALRTFPSTGTPTAEYYQEYRQINSRLKEISFFLEAKLQEKGFRAYSLARNRQNDDYRTALPFKTLATRSGLGWVGKSSTLITKQYGNAVRLNGVLTDMPLETAEPMNTSLCGDCKKCVESCPAQAITGNEWKLGVDRNDLVDPFVCKNKVIERGHSLGITVGSCGICIAVCPYTKKYMRSLGVTP